MVTTIKRETSIVHVTEPFVVLDVDLDSLALEKRTRKLGKNIVKLITNLDDLSIRVEDKLVRNFVQCHLNVIDSLLKEDDPFKFNMVTDSFNVADPYKSEMGVTLRTYTYVNTHGIPANDMDKLTYHLYDLLLTIRKVSLMKNNYTGRRTPVAIPYGLFCRKHDGIRKFSWDEVLDVFNNFSDYFCIDIVVYDHRRMGRI